MRYIVTELAGLFRDNIRESDYGVSVVEYHTNDAANLDELAINGWKCNTYDDQHKALAPRVSLCDLVDLRRVLQYDNDAVLNIAYTRFLNGLLSSDDLDAFINDVMAREDGYGGFAFHVSRGEPLGNEVKISGSDLRVNALRGDLINGFRELPECGDLCNYYQDLGVRNRALRQRGVGRVACAMFDGLESHAQRLSRSVKIPRAGHAVDTAELAKAEADILFFAPYGCFSLLRYFVDDTNCGRAMFHEMHFDEKKGVGSNFEMHTQDLDGKKVLIIDSVYSGGTIRRMREYVEQRQGFPAVVGVNPKSAGAFGALDYAMVLDKVHNVGSLGEVSDDFFETSYIETFNRHGA